MYRKPSDSQRCTGPANQRGWDNRCHNYAVSEGLCKVHLRMKGIVIPNRAYQHGYDAATADVVAWLRGSKARMDAQAKAGAQEFHYMHTIGQLDAAESCAKAIERGDHIGAAKGGE